MADHDRTPAAVVARVKTLHRRYPNLSNRELARRVGVGQGVVHRLLAGRYRRGDSNPSARLTETLVRKIRTGAWRNVAAADVARDLGIDVRTVERARSGESWRHVR